jgi:hypothetical protein
MAAFGIHELRGQAEEEFPEARFGDAFGRTREKVVGAVKGANLGERAARLRLPEVRKPGAGKAATAAGDEESRLARLERLGALHEKGILTDEEFAAEKARVLGSGTSAS